MTWVAIKLVLDTETTEPKRKQQEIKPYNWGISYALVPQHNILQKN